MLNKIWSSNRLCKSGWTQCTLPRTKQQKDKVCDKLVKIYIFTAEEPIHYIVGGDQTRAKRTVNTGLPFIRCPETLLQRNAYSLLLCVNRQLCYYYTATCNFATNCVHMSVSACSTAPQCPKKSINAALSKQTKKQNQHMKMLNYKWKSAFKIWLCHKYNGIFSKM